MASTDWFRQAACTGLHEVMFPTDYTEENIKRAQAVCARCPVVVECLRHAVVNREGHGIWGGLPPDQRAAITDVVGQLGPQSPAPSAHRQGARPHSTRPFRGVTQTSTGRWRAIITTHGHRMRLGTFNSAEAAARAYDDAARQLWGETAVLNLPD